MSIRVGRVINGKYETYPVFTPILVTTPSSKYGSLSPYCLKDEKGRYHENIWQSSKCYKQVPAISQPYSKWDSTIIWQHPAEVHIDENGYVTKEYFLWRQKLANNPYPVRYPVGFHHRHTCVCCLMENEDGTINSQPHDYISSRKLIYGPEYMRLAQKQPQYKELQNRLMKGENLLLLDVDGPHEEGMPYYKNKYNVSDDFIKNGSVLATKENLELLLNDEKYQFGHCFFLAASLLSLTLI